MSVLEPEKHGTTPTGRDYLLPKPARLLFWIAGCVVLFEQFTCGLLRNVAISGLPGASFSSAWVTLAHWAWRAPERTVLLPSSPIRYNIVPALAVAAIGSLPMFLLATARRGRLRALPLLLCIPFSLVASFISQSVGVPQIGDIETGEPNPLYDPNLAFVANASLEWILGFVVPLLSYPIVFCAALLYVIIGPRLRAGHPPVKRRSSQRQENTRPPSREDA